MNSIQHLIEIALKEDIGPGDITTDNLIDPQLKGKGFIIAKESLVVAGLNVAKQVFQYLDSEIIFRSEYNDGDFVNKGGALANVKGRLRALLSGERTSLGNFNFSAIISERTFRQKYTSGRYPQDHPGLACIRKICRTSGWRL
jgi:nicotinate-nucleotide pyrophosphorylase